MHNGAPSFRHLPRLELLRSLGGVTSALHRHSARRQRSYVWRLAAQGLVDNVVRQVLLILAVLILGTFGAALAYRTIVLRMQRHAA